MDKESIINSINNNPNKIIVGILSTSQQIKYGLTKSGKPIFQIQPIKSNLPPFWITYGGKLQGKIIISFKFKNWPDDSKLPFGEIVNIIGLATNDNLIKTLLTYYDIDRKDFKNDCLINFNENSIVRKDLTHLNVFSIDPLDCVDVDDALSFEEYDDKIIIGVHIAQPICWLSKEDIINRASKAFSTLYFNSIQDNKNLWSDEVTFNASLFQDVKKPAYSILFEIKNNIIVNITSTPSYIINKLKTDYDSVNFDIIQKTITLTEKMTGHKIDSHELVSYWMVKANNFIGNTQTGKNIPFRIQNPSEQDINLENVDEKVKTIFKNMSMESAIYSYGNRSYHSSLDLYNYTHMTSPIRRIIDTIIHYNITYNDKIEIDLDKINYLDNKTKKFHREIGLINIIDKLPDEKIVDGWIYSKNDNKWLVYFEDIGFSKVKMWDMKFNYLINKDNLNQYKIGQKYSFKLIKKMGFLPKEKILKIPNFTL